MEIDVETEQSLGTLTAIRVWHDNSGSKPAWYLNRINVSCAGEDGEDTWCFPSDQWLAVESPDAKIERKLYPKDEKELNNFSNLFLEKINDNLCDGHLWVSVLYKPAYSTFTRVQRASCCLSLLFTTMIAAAMFYNLPGSNPDDNMIIVGPFSFSLRQIMIGLQSSILVLPVNVTIVQIFSGGAQVGPPKWGRPSAWRYTRGISRRRRSVRVPVAPWCTTSPGFSVSAAR